MRCGTNAIRGAKSPNPGLFVWDGVSRDLFYRTFYPGYRAWIGRDDLVEGMAEIVRNLDWANFKDEVARRDSSRAQVYSRVWSVLGELQPGGPYSA